MSLSEDEDDDEDDEEEVEEEVMFSGRSHAVK